MTFRGLGPPAVAYYSAAQMTLPDAPRPPQRPASGEELQRLGREAVERRNREWSEGAYQRLCGVAYMAVDRSFTADEWHKHCEGESVPAFFIRAITPLQQPSHPNAYGAVVKRAYREGIIERTGRWVKSKRPAAHGRQIPEWRAK